MHAFKAIGELEGIRGLWKGTVPNMQRAAILTASQLSSYDAFKHAVLDRGWMHEGLPLHSISSIFAGTVCALTTAPIDNVKTRLMNQMVDAGGRGVMCELARSSCTDLFGFLLTATSLSQVFFEHRLHHEDSAGRRSARPSTSTLTLHRDRCRASRALQRLWRASRSNRTAHSHFVHCVRAGASLYFCIISSTSPSTRTQVTRCRYSCDGSAEFRLYNPLAEVKGFAYIIHSLK
jgi:hypothetical protein